MDQKYCTFTACHTSIPLPLHKKCTDISHPKSPDSYNVPAVEGDLPSPGLFCGDAFRIIVGWSDGMPAKPETDEWTNITSPVIIIHFKLTSSIACKQALGLRVWVFWGVGVREGKGTRACSDVPEIWMSPLKKCAENADWWRFNLVMTLSFFERVVIWSRQDNYNSRFYYLWSLREFLEKSGFLQN